MRCMITKLKHDERIVQFVLSLGIYLNTNGKLIGTIVFPQSFDLSFRNVHSDDISYYLWYA